MTISELIRSFRGERTRAAYARAIDVSSAAVHKLEAGEIRPSLTLTARICRDAGLTKRQRCGFLELLMVAAERADIAKQARESA